MLPLRLSSAVTPQHDDGDRTGVKITRYDFSEPQAGKDCDCLIYSWALRRTRKSVAFSEKAKSYLLDVFWMGEETGKKATAFDVAFK